MTCRERLKLEHPEKINDGAMGGCLGCPYDYGYLDEPDSFCRNSFAYSCRECWDQEIPEEKIPSVVYANDDIYAIADVDAAIDHKDIETIERCIAKACDVPKEVIDENKVSDACRESVNGAKKKLNELVNVSLCKVFKEAKKLDNAMSCAYEAWSRENIEKFNESGTGCAQSSEDIRKAVEKYAEEVKKGIADGIKDSGDRTEFETGAVRDMHEGKGRCDLMPLYVISTDLEDSMICYISLFQEIGDIAYLYRVLDECDIFPDKYTMYLEVAIHFEEGCKKYGENNWRKGIPLKFYIDSAVRHYLKHKRGDTDERHDRAFIWNILCCIWTYEKGKSEVDSK